MQILKKAIYLILCVFFSGASIFLTYRWILTTRYKVDNKEYAQRFGLPYGLAFAYHDYIDGGITLCDSDEKIILSSGKKVGYEQVEVKRLLCYYILSRDKVLFRFSDVNDQIQYCSVNRFHTVTYEKNIDLDNCTELAEVLTWIRSKKSFLSIHYVVFTGVLILMLITNTIAIARLFTKKSPKRGASGIFN
ncbi:hypothetical protein [Sphingobacterium faecale]|uniref:Uncharacterized protein n=1 Tax=Sphingobacterium faecale TaxID=2803775 RepID=A0ABS1R2P3_9SPHI|nr:hypothetical protein [Sphingobacterium faecale]MBL1408720.1 hypothetical protein [Sphingobacterium faecale]